MNSNYFGKYEERERETLKLEFEKFIKHSSYIVKELQNPDLEVKARGGEYVRRMIDFTYEQRILSKEGRDAAFDEDLDYEEIVFMLLGVFLQHSSIFSEVSESPRVSRAVAQKNFQELQSLLGDYVDIDSNGQNLIEDLRSIEEKLESPTLDALGILISINENTSSIEDDILLDYIDLLLQLGIIDEEKFDEVMYQSNDIDTEIYQIFKYRIFGKIIPKSSYVYECFKEYEAVYQQNSIHNFRKLISDKTLDSLGSKVLSTELSQSIIELFNENAEESFDTSRFIFLLEKYGFIGKKEIGYFASITCYNDFAFYASKIVFNKVLTSGFLSEDQENAFFIAFEGFKTTDGQSYFSIENPSLRYILDYTRSLIDIFERELYSELDNTFLNEFIDLLEKYFFYKPYYMRILHIDFDEIKELTSIYHKAIQILGILICDIVHSSHPSFETASEILLCNIQSPKNHAAVKRIIESKEGIGFQESDIPQKTKTEREGSNKNINNSLNTHGRELTIWMREVLSILESGDIHTEGKIISQFFAFLFENNFFSQEDLFYFLETGDDKQNLLKILEEIFIGNYLRDDLEQQEFIEIFVSILEDGGETQRAKELLKIIRDS